jgi:hypothetical protein
MTGAYEKPCTAIRELTHSVEGIGAAAARWNKLPGVCNCLNSSNMAEGRAAQQQEQQET